MATGETPFAMANGAEAMIPVEVGIPSPGWGKEEGRCWGIRDRGSLDKMDAPVARALDEELRRSATEASMTRSRITAKELEDLQLSYNIPSSVTLRVPGPEERADNPPEGFVAIYESAMQQGLRLPMHPFFREVLKDWNLAPCQITPNGWGQMVTSYILWVFAEAGENLTPREFESIYRHCRSSG
ncbi:Uncharacterized protein Adt_05540 [Abeliophyllum distichum]|uniref:Transposase (putative) gypsy type domain-containing protein n=1 Tax=Abeliophyllum distichum TaxID=126358 RepID=A0ABD1V4E3_9LAMI